MGKKEEIAVKNNTGMPLAISLIKLCSIKSQRYTFMKNHLFGTMVSALTIPSLIKKNFVVTPQSAASKKNA